MDRNPASTETHTQNHVSKQDLCLSIALGLMLAFAAGVASVGYPAPSHTLTHAHSVAVSHTIADTAPDWTIAPCSDWAATSTPVLPAYTRTDVCVAADGTLSVAAK